MGVFDKLREDIEQVMKRMGGLLWVPKGRKLTRLDFYEDVNGNVRYIMMWDGTLKIGRWELDDAGAAPAITWSMIRT